MYAPTYWACETLSLKIWELKQAIFISYERATKLAIGKSIFHRNFGMEKLH